MPVFRKDAIIDHYTINNCNMESVFILGASDKKAV